MASIPAESITLRPVTPEDDAFLLKVYASTRAAEMAMTGWPEVQQRAFVNMQFKLQRQGYQDQFPKADHTIILREGVPVGRMIVNRTDETEIFGVDIALLAEHRNAGIGTSLVMNLLDEARLSEKPFRIMVEKFNHGAIRLYERLGFRQTDETFTHFSMEWKCKNQGKHQRR